MSTHNNIVVDSLPENNERKKQETMECIYNGKEVWNRKKWQI